MPLHARGAHYFGKIGLFLKCTGHQQIADELFQTILEEDGVGYKSTKCESCGTTINVTARAGGEWEFQEYFPGSPERR